MRRHCLIALVGLVFVMCSALANAFEFRLEATPHVNDTTVKMGVPFSIDIYMNNNDSLDNSDGFRTGISMPLTFYSVAKGGYSAINTITHVNVGGEGPTGNMVFFNGFQGTPTSPIWSAYKEIYCESYDGTLPDKMNYTGLTLTGWSFKLGELKYMEFHFQIDQEGWFCVDSGDMANDNYDWLWEDPSPSFGGPYCWLIAQGEGVREIETDLLPKDFELGQNYPNPFNSSTVIEFALPVRAKVNISIFNVLGQRVKTVVDDEYEAGRYMADWDGTSENGQAVASGMYFYKIEADNKYSNTKKLMILK
jgi:hypothetical protein